MHKTLNTVVSKIGANRRLPRAAWKHLSRHVAADFTAAEPPTEAKDRAGAPSEPLAAAVSVFWEDSIVLNV